MTQPSIVIIGAGIAGLSAGSYLQRNGYDTRIYESHSIPGGLCTSWKRRGYTFDGCIHWLAGSGPASPFNTVWSELLDMNSVRFAHHDRRFDIELSCRDRHGDPVFHVYADLDRLELYMRDIAPEDSSLIAQFIASVRELQRYPLPPLWDIAPEVRTIRDNLSLVKYVPFLLYARKWGKVTNYDLAKRFRSPFLREGFERIFAGMEFSILGATMQLAIFDQKCGGFPIGGSLPFARKIEQRYLSLGGQIHYKSPVTAVLVEDDVAVGVQLQNGERCTADTVISAADGHWTIFEALGGRYLDQSIADLYDGKTLQVFESMILVSLGLRRTFEDAPHLLRFLLDQPLTIPDGTALDWMEAHTYNYDPTLAPEGKTVLTVTLYTRNHAYWTGLRAHDLWAYRTAKQELARNVIERLDRRLGDIQAHVEVIDVATPATIISYTGNWQGSYQGWYPSESLLSATPLKKELPGLDRFYMIGQWMEPGGGLPVVALSGRNVAQIICRRDGKEFSSGAS